ncbi:MAG TPA: DSD1 family PLP-dependent enzyme [Terriglobia bacterium]|nr:DSD1 family PLP-dependent enzyme [Terriglobia bacterium]
MKKILELPTPCLVVDLDRFESNLNKMSRYTGECGIALRPHAKTHKCVNIARRQLEKGAIGICVATIAEAEVMVRGGIRGLVITGEIVGEPKIPRFIRVVSQAPDTMVVVDDVRNVRDLQKAAQDAGIQIRVLIDLDIGQNRTGIQPGPPALGLAERIADAKNLEFKGICAYAGHVAHITGFENRRADSRRALTQAVETRDLLIRNGHSVQVLTGASTGTYNIDPELEGLTELQSGSYVFMDVEYRRIGAKGGAVYEDFAPSLCVLATVIHRSGRKAVVDAGLKAFSTDRPFGPEPLEISGVHYEFAGDEHGRLVLENPGRDIQPGEKLRFIIPHCDPTVNLYDRFFCVRGDIVEDEWPIMERAAGAPYF